MSHSSVSFRAAAIGLVLVSVACVEPKPRPDPVLAPAAYQLSLVASDDAPKLGDTVHVRVAFHATHSVAIGSFTGRVDFDPSALRFVRESLLDDGVSRVSNPGDGDVRFAGMSAKGFSGPVISDFVFVATAAGTRATQSLRLVLTQLGTTDAADLRRYLSVTSPARRNVP
jgi:hypothetical protein